MINITNKTSQTDLCDLHTHSAYSDGTFTPEELVRAAKSECNLRKWTIKTKSSKSSN